MDLIAGFLARIIIDVILRGTGHKILTLFGRNDDSKDALDTVGTAFWFVIFAAIYFGLRMYLNG
jgi:hypothetical protein